MVMCMLEEKVHKMPILMYKVPATYFLSLLLMRNISYLFIPHLGRDKKDDKAVLFWTPKTNYQNRFEKLEQLKNVDDLNVSSIY